MQVKKQRYRVKVCNFAGVFLDDFDISEGANLWTFLRKRGFFSGYCCTGLGMCGHCAVTVAKNCASSLSIETEYETNKLSLLGMGENVRLSCLVEVHGDLEIFLPG